MLKSKGRKRSMPQLMQSGSRSSLMFLGGSVFVFLLRSSTDLMRPTHCREDKIEELPADQESCVILIYEQEINFYGI